MEYVSSERKLLPYGMMNFADIRLDNYYYVDKTSFIPVIEQSDRFFFFIRPRRFGKSLTLNMLQHYYDVRTRDSSMPCLATSISESIPHETVTVIWCCISISQELVESCTTTVKGWMHIAIPASIISVIFMQNTCRKALRKS